MFFLSSYDHFQRKLIIIAKSQGFFPWLFSLSWEQRKVGEILEERDEQAPKSSEYPLMAFIANEGVAPKGDRYDRSALVNDTENKPYKKTEYGDFIYSSNNLETGSIGLNTYGKASISPVYSIFHPTDLADSDFIGRRLVRKDFINEMVKWRQGVIYGQWRIHESDFIKIEIPVPSLAEQKRIGAFFKSLDDLIALHQHEPLFLVMLFFGGSYIFKSAWEQRKLGEIVDVRSGRDYKHLSEGSIPVYGTGGYMLSVNEALSYDEDAIGIGRKGTIDKPYVLKAPFWTVDTLFYAVPSKNVDLDFAFCIFQNVDWKKKDESTGVPSLSKTAINSIDVVTPSFKEQQEIGSFFRSLDDLITLHQRKGNLREKKSLDFAWEQRKFGDTVIIERGGSPRPIEAFITEAENGLNWVKIGDAPTMGNYITKTAEKIRPEGLSKTREVHPGDLLLSNSMSFGKPYIMGINGCIHDGWLLIRNESKTYDLAFLCHLLGTQQMLDQYKSLAAGSTVNNLNKELVGSTIVLYPTMQEQKVIGTLLNSLDTLITLHQREHKSNFRRKTNVKQSTRDRPFLLLLCSVDKGLQRGSGP